VQISTPVPTMICKTPNGEGGRMFRTWVTLQAQDMETLKKSFINT